MLFERWREIARAHANDLAVRDLTTSSEWSFQELADAVGGWKVGPGPVFPQGHSVEFILAVLAAWGHGVVVCPLEPGQKPPEVPIPPSTIVHMKTTSASTGRPRLVAFKPSQLAADAENIVATMGLRQDWPNLGII